MANLSKILAMSALLLSLTGTASAQMTDQEFCLRIVRASAEDSLRLLTPGQIEKGLCKAVKATTLASLDGDDTIKTLCFTASQGIGREFKRRFPKDDLARVKSLC